jgi:raffinose/stachyose/melibiose transport system permease protein
MGNYMNKDRKIIAVSKKISLFFVTVVLILIIPLYTLIKKIGRLFQSDFLSISKYQSKNYLIDYVVNSWLGDKEKAQSNRVFVFFLFPALFAFILFVFIPFVHGIYLSMTDWDGLNTGRESFVGFANYQSIFSDVKFIFSFYRTILYSILNIVIINLVAFLLALLVTQNLKLKNVYRA